MPRGPAEEWNSELVRKRFATKRTQLGSYILEKEAQFTRGPKRGSTEVQHAIACSTAESNLYGRLATSAALESRLSFLAELAKLRSASLHYFPTACLDPAKYTEAWFRQIDALLQEYALP